MKEIFVICDEPSKLDELVGVANALSQKVSVVDFGFEISDISADFVIKFDQKAQMIEDYANSIAEILKDKDALVLMPSNRVSKALGARLSVLLNASIATEVKELRLENDKLMAKRLIYGGVAEYWLETDSKIAIALLSPGAAQKANSSKTPVQISANFIAPKHKIELLSSTPKQKAGVDLSSAKKIVAIGRGVANESDLAMVNELCLSLGAELGCTRPIAESSKWLPHERYIGISSVMARPNFYLALGVSGQIQHMIGIKDAGKIIAINKDKNAPIFEYADYGIVGDLYKVVPEILKAIKG